MIYRLKPLETVCQNGSYKFYTDSKSELMITMKMAWCSFRPDDLDLVLKLEFVYLSFTQWKSQLFCPGKVVGINRLYKNIQQIHYQVRIRTRKDNPGRKTTATAWYFTILWLVSLRFVWCSFVSPLQGETWKPGKGVKKTGEFFLTTYQNIEKSLVVFGLYKEEWYELDHFCGSASWVV